MKQAVLKQQGVLAIADVQEDLTLQADEAVSYTHLTLPTILLV